MYLPLLSVIRLTAQVLMLGLMFAGPSSAQAEKVLRLGVVSLPGDLGNPYGSYTIPTVAAGLAVFDSLTVLDIDGVVQPWIAERWEVVDELTWHFTLKPNVKFSSGEPFDASAAAAALMYFASGDGLVEVVAQSVIDVESARAVDPLTLEIKTKQPNILLPRRLSGLRIPAPGPWAELGRKGFGMAPVGSGAFIATRWDTTRIELVANPNAWRPPALDRIEMIGVPEVTTRVQGLITGAVDIAFDIGPDNGPLLERSGARLKFRPSGRIQVITFMSVGDSPVADLRVRQALNYAIDKQSIVDLLLGGAAEITGQAADRGAFGYNPAVKP